MQRSQLSGKALMLLDLSLPHLSLPIIPVMTGKVLHSTVIQGCLEPTHCPPVWLAPTTFWSSLLPLSPLTPAAAINNDCVMRLSLAVAKYPEQRYITLAAADAITQCSQLYTGKKKHALCYALPRSFRPPLLLCCAVDTHKLVDFTCCPLHPPLLLQPSTTSA
jgi:hypothetical protein